MAKTIVWTKRANNRFNDIAEYLNQEWGEKVAQTFAEQAYGIIETLSEFPELGPVENEKRGIRGFSLTRHNKLFYRYTKDRLIILNIFDNRKHTNKKRY